MTETGGTVPRWFTETADDHSEAYVRRFRSLAAEGADIVGEARFMDALLSRGSRVLDAGCGPGRVGAELARRGHEVVGVDVDPTLIAAASEDHEGPTWVVADLATLDLAGDRFDAVVCAGNVLPYLAPETERAVLTRLHAHVRPDGVGVFGFGTGRGYPLDRFDADAAAAGWVLEHRFATWDLRPWPADPAAPDAAGRTTAPDAAGRTNAPEAAGRTIAGALPDFAVTVLRRP